LRKWVEQVERDRGQRSGLTTEEHQRLKDLERENRELKRTNEILRNASAYFAGGVRPPRQGISTSSMSSETRMGSSRSVRWCTSPHRPRIPMPGCIGYLGHRLMEYRRGLIVDAQMSVAEGFAERGAATTMLRTHWR
jgi:hypothetical protein